MYQKYDRGSSLAGPFWSNSAKIAFYLMLAQTYPAGSRKREINFSKFIRLLETKLSHNKYKLGSQDFGEVQQDVRLILWTMLDKLRISNLEKLIYVLLQRKGVDKIRQLMQHQTLSLDSLIADETITDNGSSFLDYLTQPLPEPEIAEWEAVWHLFSKDPDQVFQKALKKCPHVTFQAIVLGFLEGATAKELAQIWGTKEQTIYSHNRREMRRLADYLQTALSE